MDKLSVVLVAVLGVILLGEKLDLRQWGGIVLITAGVVAVLYGGLVLGFLPRQGVSFEGHLFGAFAGFIAAKVLLSQPRSRFNAG